MSRFTDLFQKPVATPKKAPVVASEPVTEVKEKVAEKEITTPIIKAIQEKSGNS